MVMPFADEIATNNYNHSIKPICEHFDMEVRRADEIFSSGTIYGDIVNEIKEASVIIVDITHRNPNVFYELGMAHTIKPKKTIMITKDSYGEVPLDIAHFRIIKYEDSIKGKDDFDQALRKTMESLLSDPAELFEEEFDFAYSILYSSKKFSNLIGLVGLRKYTGVLSFTDSLSFEGCYVGGESIHHTRDARDNYFNMQALGNVKFENEIITVTSKGQAFADFLLRKGIDCHVFQGEILTTNYKSIAQRAYDSKL